MSFFAPCGQERFHLKKTKEPNGELVGKKITECASHGLLIENAVYLFCCGVGIECGNSYGAPVYISPDDSDLDIRGTEKMPENL